MVFLLIYDMTIFGRVEIGKPLLDKITKIDGIIKRNED